jgi:hypothetical protein
MGEINLSSKVISDLIEESKRTEMTIEDFMKRFNAE